MFNKIRFKFILISMLSVILVLSTILSVINIVNYSNIINKAKHQIELIKNEPKDNPNPHPSDKLDRYFTITLDNEGNVIDSDLTRAFMLSEDEAFSYAIYLYQNNQTDGFYNDYRYDINIVNNNTTYIFIDCHMELENYYSFLTTSILVGIGGILVVFGLIFFLSKKIMRPIIESYNKQKQFITDAGHELKTPLTIISANNDIIELEYGISEWTKGIKDEVKRLSSLTEKLIYLAKLDENRNIKFSNFNLSELTKDTTNAFIPLMNTNHINFKEDIDDNINYYGNSDMLKELIVILLDNAIKYQDGNYINLSLKQDNNKITLKVINKASYLTKDNISSIFDRFKRVDNHRNSSTGGHGLGLSIAKAIINSHKGKINVDLINEEIIFTINL